MIQTRVILFLWMKLSYQRNQVNFYNAFFRWKTINFSSNFYLTIAYNILFDFWDISRYHSFLIFPTEYLIQFIWKTADMTVNQRYER